MLDHSSGFNHVVGCDSEGEPDLWRAERVSVHTYFPTLYHRVEHYTLLLQVLGQEHCMNILTKPATGMKHGLSRFRPVIDEHLPVTDL